jgi:hypothetical protein
MTDIYADLQAVARDVLAEVNQGVIKYIKITPGTGPGDNPGAPVENSYTLDGAVARGVSQKYVMKSLAVASDLQLTMSVRTDGVVPDIRGFIEMDGERYKIVHVDTIPPAGTPVVHVIIFRK